MPKRKNKIILNDHEKKFLMDGERKHTIEKSVSFLGWLLGQKSTINNQRDISEAIDTIHAANDSPKSKLKNIRKRLTRR